MASTIKNKFESNPTSVNANPAIYSLGFLVLFIALAYALLQLLPLVWFELLKFPPTSTSNITLAIIGFGLGIFSLVIIGKTKIFQELPGLKAGILVGFVITLANLYFDSWWGKFTETLVYDKRFFPESFGMGLAGAGAALAAIGSFILFFRPDNLKLFTRIEEQGWFSRESFKQNQGSKIRRGTIICLLILFGTGIMVLVRNDTLARNGSNWKIEIPYTGKVKINPDKTADALSLLQAEGYNPENQLLVSREAYRKANSAIDPNLFVKIGLLTGDSKYKIGEIVSKDAFQEESRELLKNDRKPAESIPLKSAEGTVIYKSLILLPGIQFSGPILLIILSVWISWKVVNIPVFADFLIATEAEMNKVSWTTNKKLFHDTIVVLTTLVLMSLFLFVMDQFWRIFLTKAGVLRFGQDSVQKNTSVDLKKW
ncbi:MAG: preprotein translocase subunit SecE [Planctomycetes bacterium]|nr:preprotein translocase subunit SecE [Planctomycetota bacterium]